jgi:hypothetical protein
VQDPKRVSVFLSALFFSGIERLLNKKKKKKFWSLLSTVFRITRMPRNTCITRVVIFVFLFFYGRYANGNVCTADDNPRRIRTESCCTRNTSIRSSSARVLGAVDVCPCRSRAMHGKKRKAVKVQMFNFGQLFAYFDPARRSYRNAGGLLAEQWKQIYFRRVGRRLRFRRRVTRPVPWPTGHGARKNNSHGRVGKRFAANARAHPSDTTRFLETQSLLPHQHFTGTSCALFVRPPVTVHTALRRQTGRDR